MKRIKRLVNEGKYIGHVIDGNKVAVDFGGERAGRADELATGVAGASDTDLYWRGEKLVTGTAFTLLPPDGDTIGGVYQGDRVTIAPDGKISANQQWSDMQGEMPDVGDFPNTIEYQTKTEVTNTIIEKLGELEYVKDVEQDDESGTVTVTMWNDSEKFIEVPKLDLVDAFDYDEEEKDIIITMKDGKELKINVKDLVDVYTASTEYPNVQIVIEENVIKAILLLDSVTKEHLTTELQLEITNKANKDLSAVPGNIVIFKEGGDIEDSGERLDDFVRKIDDIELEIEQHDHDGVNSAKVNYNNLLERPVILFEDDDVPAGNKVYDFGTNLYNVEYVITRGAAYQTGVLKVRYEDILELDVFGEDVNVSFSVDGSGRLTVNTAPGAAADIKLLVFFFSVGKKSFSSSDYDESFEQ